MSTEPTTAPAAETDISTDTLTESHDSSVAVTRYVVVEINSSQYGIPTDSTVELMSADSVDVTRVPGSPSFINGVLNHRGSIIPVVDTRTMLGLPALPPAHSGDDTPEPMLVITEFDNRTAGFTVDAVHTVRDCLDDDVEALPDSTAHAEFLRGLVHLPDGDYILICDLEQMYELACPR